MPNICIGEISISGRRECVRDFILTLKSQPESYDPKSKLYRHPHFFRIFSVYNDEVIEDEYGMLETRIIQFECAWSAYSCMCEGPFSYYAQCKTEHEAGNDRYKEFYGSTIEKECKRLGLFVEVYTEEPGIGFQEHYVVTPNGIEVDEEFPLDEYFISEYKNYQDLLDAYGEKRTRLYIDEDLFNELKKDNIDYYSPNRIDDYAYEYAGAFSTMMGDKKDMCIVVNK